MYISGWWLSHPFEKYESQLGLLFPIYGKIKAMFQTTNQIYIYIYIGVYLGMYVHIIAYIRSLAKLLSGSEPLTIYRMRIQEDPFPWGDLCESLTSLENPPVYSDLPGATSVARSRGFPRFHDTGGPSSPRSRPRFFQQNWAFFRIFFDQKSLVILATDGSLEAITPGFGLRTGSKQIAENIFPIWHGHGKWMLNYTHHRYVHWKC